MLTSTNIDFCFNLDTGKFVFTDVTDYTSQSVALSAITGVIKVTAPSGVVYSGGSPDINGSVSRTNTTTINIPLLASGKPEVGNYKIDYTVTDGSNTVSTSKTFKYSYSSPTVSIDATADCISPELTSTDTTNYLSGSTTPSNQFSILSADSATKTIVIEGEKVGLFAAGDTFYIINSTGNDGEHTVASISFNGTNTEIVLTALADDTDDGTVATKTNTIYYPQVLNLSPVVGYTTTVSVNSFYTETQEFQVITRSFYDFGNGVSLVDVTSGSTELKVDCDVRLCEVYCCIDSVLRAYLNYKDSNAVLAQRYLDKYIIATGHLSALRNAFECGKNNSVNTLVNEIFRVTECNPDCSCSDGEPAPVTGIGATSNTVVATSGNGILVSSNVVGNTTTYTLSLSPSILSAIAAASATSSVISSDGSLTVTSTTVGANTEYDVTVTTPAITPKEFAALEIELNFNGDIASPTLTLSNETYNNQTNLQTGVLTEVSSPGIYNPFLLSYTGFQVTGNTTYKVLTSISYADYDAGFAGVNPMYYPASLQIIPITHKESNSISFAFNYNGSMIGNYSLLKKYPTIKLNVIIIE